MRQRCLLALVLPFLLGADWPEFRGPGGQGWSEEKSLPTRWSKTENLRWSAELPGRGLSSPIIVGDRVFLTACTGFQQTRLHVLCFEAATGKLLWERKLWATGGTSCHPKTNMAAPTPVTDGRHVYALFATGDLACYDRDGNLVWYRSLVGDYPTVGNNVGMQKVLDISGLDPDADVCRRFPGSLSRRGWLRKQLWKTVRPIPVPARSALAD